RQKVVSHLRPPQEVPKWLTAATFNPLRYRPSADETIVSGGSTPPLVSQKSCLIPAVARSRRACYNPPLTIGLCRLFGKVAFLSLAKPVCSEEDEDVLQISSRHNPAGFPDLCERRTATPRGRESRAVDRCRPVPRECRRCAPRGRAGRTR